MPDLGKYGSEVLTAYGLSILLLLVISAMTYLRSRRIRRALDAAEARRADG